MILQVNTVRPIDPMISVGEEPWGQDMQDSPPGGFMACVVMIIEEI